jgi:L-asparagine transporter-like permease
MYSGAVSIFLPEAQKKNEVKNLLSTIYKNVYLTSIIFTVVIVLGSNVFAQFLSDKIYQNIMPMTLYTMMIMGATPLYESSKMTLQSLDDEKWVLKITSLINVSSVLVLLVIQLLGIQTYYTLYFVYGLSLLILSYSFIKRRQSRDNL